MYQVQFLPEATEALGRLDKPVAQRLLKKLRWLAENFDSLKPESLAGPFGSFLKFRVGDYRIIYRVDRQNRRLTIVLVGHRREIYQLGS
jgi:mRNA interferase RelE/StbE